MYILIIALRGVRKMEESKELTITDRHYKELDSRITIPSVIKNYWAILGGYDTLHKCKKENNFQNEQFTLEKQ